MNIALILAAGSGTRMGNTSKPKQFLPIYNKPLIVHTIEAFEMHEDIDYEKEKALVTDKILDSFDLVISIQLKFGVSNMI